MAARDRETEGTITAIGARLAEFLDAGGRLLTCGNGGSMCDAMHLAQELSGHFRGQRRALAAQSISDPSHLTCVANDEGFERVFARGVEAWGTKGDVLVVFSTSGNSANVVAAVDAARTQGPVHHRPAGARRRRAGRPVRRVDRGAGHHLGPDPGDPYQDRPPAD